MVVPRQLQPRDVRMVRQRHKHNAMREMPTAARAGRVLPQAVCALNGSVNIRCAETPRQDAATGSASAERQPIESGWAVRQHEGRWGQRDVRAAVFSRGTNQTAGNAALHTSRWHVVQRSVFGQVRVVDPAMACHAQNNRTVYVRLNP